MDHETATVWTPSHEASVPVGAEHETSSLPSSRDASTVEYSFAGPPVYLLTESGEIFLTEDGDSFVVE